MSEVDQVESSARGDRGGQGGQKNKEHRLRRKQLEAVLRALPENTILNEKLMACVEVSRNHTNLGGEYDVQRKRVEQAHQVFNNAIEAAGREVPGSQLQSSNDDFRLKFTAQLVESFKLLNQQTTSAIIELACWNDLAKIVQAHMSEYDKLSRDENLRMMLAEEPQQASNDSAGGSGTVIRGSGEQNEQTKENTENLQKSNTVLVAQVKDLNAQKEQLQEELKRQGQSREGTDIVSPSQVDGDDTKSDYPRTLNTDEYANLCLIHRSLWRFALEAFENQTVRYTKEDENQAWVIMIHQYQTMLRVSSLLMPPFLIDRNKVDVELEFGDHYRAFKKMNTTWKMAKDEALTELELIRGHTQLKDYLEKTCEKAKTLRDRAPPKPPTIYEHVFQAVKSSSLLKATLKLV